MGVGDTCKVKPLRRAHWIPAVVQACDGEVVTVRTQEQVGRIMAHRFFTVPADRVRAS